MSYDYGPIIATGEQLVKQYGRKFEMVKLATGVADVAKAWDTPTGTPTKKEFYGVFMNPYDITRMGYDVALVDLVKISKRFVMVVSTEELHVYQKAIDDGQTYTITGMTALKPGSTALLWMIGLSG